MVFEKWCEKNCEKVLPEQLDKVLERFFAPVSKQDGTDHDSELNLSPMIRTCNQMLTSEIRK